MEGYLTGQLIIANPAAADVPSFQNCAGYAVYILQHSDEGAVGVALNKNYSNSLSEISKNTHELSLLNPDWLLSEKVMMGGPVVPSAPWLLTSNSVKYEKQFSTQDLCLNFLDAAFQEHTPSHRAVCGLGTFGWGPQQLEREIARFLWHIIPTSENALSTIPFDTDFIGAANLLAALKYG